MHALGGDSLQKSINPAPIFPVSSSPSFGLSCSSTPAFHFEAHDSSHCSISGTVSPSFARARPFPESTEHPPAELLPSTRGSTFSSNPFCAVREKKSSNPFWLPSAQSSFSSGDLQSLTQGHSSYTPGLPFYHYLPSKLASMGITPPLSHTEFLKNHSTYCPSSYQSPFTAQVGGAHSASASTQSMVSLPIKIIHLRKWTFAYVIYNYFSLCWFVVSRPLQHYRAPILQPPRLYLLCVGTIYSATQQVH